MNEARAAELCRTIHHWLAFQRSCGRLSLFSEAYLAQPVGEFIRAHHSGPIRPEWTIPDLKSGARGRPRQLDYVLLSRDTGRLIAAIEAKWVKAKPVDPQRIINDLLRLERLRDNTGQAVLRYFVVAGISRDFERYFRSRKVRSKDREQDFLRPVLDRSKTRKKRVRVHGVGNPWKGYYENFAETYGVELPRGFITKRLESCDADGVSVWLWKVMSRKNRRTYAVTG